MPQSNHEKRATALPTSSIVHGHAAKRLGRTVWPENRRCFDSSGQSAEQLGPEHRIADYATLAAAVAAAAVDAAGPSTTDRHCPPVKTGF